MIADKKWILTNYERFNEKYFDGELPKIQAKISHAKRYLGRASASYDLDNRSMCDFTIAMSNYYDQPESNMHSTLLHEMIHIKDYYMNGPEIYENHWRQKKHRGHGEYFLKEAARITNESGFKIDVKATEDVMSKCILSEDTRKKIDTPYLMFISKDFKVGYGVFRLPKDFSAKAIQDLMKWNKLNTGYVLEGVFDIFAGKRGSMKSGRLIDEDRYAMYFKQAIKASPVLWTTDSLSDITKKINNRK